MDRRNSKGTKRQSLGSFRTPYPNHANHSNLSNHYNSTHSSIHHSFSSDIPSTRYAMERDEDEALRFGTMGGKDTERTQRNSLPTTNDWHIVNGDELNVEETQSSLVHTGEEGTSSEEEEVDPELNELIEREEIIEKYDKGPVGSHVESYENPDDDINAKKDRYGFLHKDLGELQENRDSAKRRKQREAQRRDKWLLMLKEWDTLEREDRQKNARILRRPTKLIERVYKGIPESVRGMVWMRLLDIGELKRSEEERLKGRINTSIYNELLLRARLKSKDIKQIDLDINRTYRDNEAFRNRYNVKQQSLLNVLSAYSMYNTEVGYCQGMSQIVALLLMYLADDEDVFWCLHALMIRRHHTFHGFFVPGFPKLSRFETHFKTVLRKYKPKIYRHLEKEFIPYIYLTKWWFGCFLDRIPYSLALRVWDIMMVEGDCVLIAMALNIFKMHEKTILKLHMETFMEFIQSTIANDFGYTDDSVIFSLEETMQKLRRDRLLHPKPPSEADLPEVPVKALGPILFRPLGDIRSEIAEIQSRKSRANSTATGKSPYPRRKERNLNINAAGSASLRQSIERVAKDPKHPQMGINSIRERNGPLNSSVLGSLKQQERRSTYDNLQRGEEEEGREERVRVLRDERTGREVGIVREVEDWDNERWEGDGGEEFTVRHTSNHVTYVTIGEDDPPPRHSFV